MQNPLNPRLSIVTPPSTAVLDPYLKDHLHGIPDEQLPLLLSYQNTAREYCAGINGRALATTTYNLTLDRFPFRDGIIKIPRPPLVSITYIKYIEEAGDQVTLGTTKYIVDIGGEPGRIAPAHNEAWPDTQDRIAAVEIQFVAGYTAANLPESLKQAMRLLVGHFYENREATVEKALAEVPLAVQSLLGINDYGRFP